MRMPATSGGTLTSGRRTGRGADGRRLGDLPRVLDGGVADDGLVDLQAAVDDVEERRSRPGTRSTASGRNE